MKMEVTFTPDEITSILKEHLNSNKLVSVSHTVRFNIETIPGSTSFSISGGRLTPPESIFKGITFEVETGID